MYDLLLDDVSRWIEYNVANIYVNILSIHLLIISYLKLNQIYIFHIYFISYKKL
jgi:hypothetical protein